MESTQNARESHRLVPELVCQLLVCNIELNGLVVRVVMASPGRPHVWSLPNAVDDCLRRVIVFGGFHGAKRTQRAVLIGNLFS
jgi:hypothetical protein